MDVKNCRGCGRLFNYIGGVPLCPSCMKKLDQKFTDVKKYIYDNPGAGIQQVAEENSVPVQQIRNWIREERLEFSKDSDVGLECEGCGTMIKTGRFCPKCKDTMANALNSVYQKKKPEVKKKPVDAAAKMRFLDN